LGKIHKNIEKTPEGHDRYRESRLGLLSNIWQNIILNGEDIQEYREKYQKIMTDIENTFRDPEMTAREFRNHFWDPGIFGTLREHKRY
jgi:hypothetical protein